MTSEISKQVFPFTLDTDAPAFRAGLERLRHLAGKIAEAKAEGGLFGGLRRIGLTAAAGATLLRLYLHPVQDHETPELIRLAPTW
ncbi:MAG: hypothetical protein ACMVO3_21105 [Thalassobaculum sp.]